MSTVSTLGFIRRRHASISLVIDSGAPRSVAVKCGCVRGKATVASMIKIRSYVAWNSLSCQIVVVSAMSLGNSDSRVVPAS